MAAQVVHDDDIAGRQCGHEELLDVFEEARAVDRLIQHTGGIDPVAAQSREERHRFPVTIRHFGVKPLTLGCPAAQGGHVGFGPCFINEHEAAGINPPLILLPLLAPPGHLGPELFGGQHAFF